MKEDLCEIISNLNDELYDNFSETELCFGYSTNGYVEIITFADTILWDSENSDRKWIEEEKRYEDFEPYIKSVYNKWADKMYSLKFK